MKRAVVRQRNGDDNFIKRVVFISESVLVLNELYQNQKLIAIVIEFEVRIASFFGASVIAESKFEFWSSFKLELRV